MAEDEKAGSDVSINVTANIAAGKELDRSAADILSSLFNPAATELGNLVGDTIGLLSDKVRRKREANAQAGLIAVHEKLAASNVDTAHLSHMKEEDVGLLLNGLSNTDAPDVRDLWAGLFAQALDPNSGVSAERPFISVLQSLTPMDAKIIDFLAFAVKTDADLRENLRFRPQKLNAITREEADAFDALRAEAPLLRDAAVTAIRQKATAYGIDRPSFGWADNLFRQGIIERMPVQQIPSPFSRTTRSDERAIQNNINRLHRQMESMIKSTALNEAMPTEIINTNSPPSSFIFLNVQLTHFGSRLAKACDLL